MPQPTTGPRILAVDGRSAGGKSSLANRLAEVAGDATIVCSDDVAWWESFFEWDHLMIEGVLEPLRLGRDVSYRPPAWDARSRDGAIVVPRDTHLVIVEGAGVSRCSLVPWIDGAIWVQSDLVEAKRRGVERDGGDQAAADFWNEWARSEIPFMRSDRPWERTQAILCGTPGLTGINCDPSTDVLVGRSLRPAGS